MFMELEPKAVDQNERQGAVFGRLAERSPLLWLRDIEQSLRHRTLAAIVPALPKTLAIHLSETSSVAKEIMNELAQIDLAAIDVAELQPTHLKIGLTFTGFSALAMVLLLLYLSALHPGLDSVHQLHHYWYGVAGLMMLGREAMRPPQ